MSWSIEEHIGEGRPWPGKIEVYRGETSECLAYVSGEVVDMLIAENVKLREENQAIGMAAYEMGRKSMADENAKLRELLVDSIMDVRAYAEKYGIEPLWATVDEHIADRMRELGIEVGS